MRIDELESPATRLDAGRVARAALHWLALAAVALVGPLAAGELALRLIYLDGGRRTPGGPGGRDFEYAFNPDGPSDAERHPVPAGPKTPGVTRIAIQGDSITWGVGVFDWTRLYPSQLLERLRRDGAFDLVVDAVPGYNMDRHADHVSRLVDHYAPDVLVYQWYPNDLDAGIRRDVPPRAWQTWEGHPALLLRSYLYFFLDRRLDHLVANPYQRHLQRDFAVGSPGWSRFRDAFHRWATVASARVPRTIVLLYPQVPFRGANPLGDIQTRVIEAATAASRLEYHPEVQRGAVGGLVDDRTTRSGVARASDGRGGVLVRAGEIPLLPGHYVLDVRLRPDERIAVGAVHVRVVEQPGGHALADADVSADPPGVWTTHQLAFDVATTPMASDVEFRVEVAAGVALSVETIGLDVHYPYLEVLDPTAALNTFDTHVSLFDSHPNERAHEVLAEQLYARLRRR